MRLGRVVIIASSVFCVAFVAFALYVVTLFGHLKKAFLQQEEFVPTRLYSDVSRIAPSRTARQRRGAPAEPGLCARRGSRRRTHPPALRAARPGLSRVPDPRQTSAARFWPKEGEPRPPTGPSIDLTFDSEEKDIRSCAPSSWTARSSRTSIWSPSSSPTLSQNGTEGKRKIREYLDFAIFPRSWGRPSSPSRTSVSWSTTGSIRAGCSAWSGSISSRAPLPRAAARSRSSSSKTSWSARAKTRSGRASNSARADARAEHSSSRSSCATSTR